jgi:methylmalonyl-CoA decarboxylase subunit alpha
LIVPGDKGEQFFYLFETFCFCRGKEVGISTDTGMNSRHLKADFMFAWPTAEIAVMGPEGAANIIFRKEIKESANPEETRKQKVAEYREKFANPYVAASKGYIDSVIEPSETRLLLKHSIEVSGNKTVMTPAKKHGIPPF